MKKLILILIVLVSGSVVRAQDPNNAERLESFKIAFLTKRLDLSPVQAREFWPLYNEFNDKRRDLRLDRAKIRIDMNKSEVSNEDAKEILDQQYGLKKKELELEKEYFDKFLNILPPQKVLDLLKAEADFNKEILNRLRRRFRGGQGPR